MILIHSEEFDMSTCEVMDWIRHLGYAPVRLNGEDFLAAGNEITLELDNSLHELRALHNGRAIDFPSVQSFWFRRGAIPAKLSPVAAFTKKSLYEGINKHYHEEVDEARRNMYHSLGSLPRVLGTPVRKGFSKFSNLLLARECGIDIPATLISCNKSEIERFQQKYGQVIIKPVTECEFFEVKEDKLVFSLYTNEFNMPEQFPQGVKNMVQLQELLDKEVELRVFHVAGKNFAMAIFSQLDNQTRVDFRRYNMDKPNRNVPFKLPDELEIKLNLLMQKARLNTGSIDLIYTSSGRFVFLEINPVGQFGMTSKPCNYQLEKYIARYLTQKNG
jgi:ATP-GRASP peptide maturase of grasp-with-spasm system